MHKATFTPAVDPKAAKELAAEEAAADAQMQAEVDAEKPPGTFVAMAKALVAKPKEHKK